MKFNNVYVKNSVESTIDEGLKDVFTEHGAITIVVMMRDANEKSKCFEFVNFEKAKDADEAVKTLNGKEIDGEECYVGKWYMKTRGATFEENPDGYLGQNRKLTVLWSFFHASTSKPGLLTSTGSPYKKSGVNTKNPAAATLSASFLHIKNDETT
ncbi:hypothetical protein SADUNF_Sadunf07G0097000 [Salix dunnii]|uniref:RRM domain-containing protein n=1 Tax=Salix dunnii TaxID=1413687 RepID=A0A835MW48_9ROSI|nr:hypothetical protein SADUNF_Sadunf07G0097000 [Salix dunnii]